MEASARGRGAHIKARYELVNSLCRQQDVDVAVVSDYMGVPSYLGGSSNGRTPDSGSGYLGSNPSPPALRLRLVVFVFVGPIV